MIFRYFNDSPLFPTLADGAEPLKPSRCSALTRNIGKGGFHSVLLLRCSHLHVLPQIGWGLVEREQRGGEGGEAAQLSVSGSWERGDLSLKSRGLMGGTTSMFLYGTNLLPFLLLPLCLQYCAELTFSINTS